MPPRATSGLGQQRGTCTTRILNLKLVYFVRGVSVPELFLPKFFLEKRSNIAFQKLVGYSFQYCSYCKLFSYHVESNYPGLKITTSIFQTKRKEPDKSMRSERKANKVVVVFLIRFSKMRSYLPKQIRLKPSSNRQLILQTWSSCKDDFSCGSSFPSSSMAVNERTVEREYTEQCLVSFLL